MSGQAVVEQVEMSARRDAAATRATQNRAANLAALAENQPWLGESLGQVPQGAAWVFGRDGSLTAMQGQRWWARCSLPLRAARFMLKSLDIQGTLACFLSPMHAAQVRVALEKLQPRQAIVAIVPEPATLAVLLSCDDFSQEVRRHRLWLVSGEQWSEQLRRLFVENPGLPTPSQFIRPILADSAPADRLIAPAQQIFAEESARRTAQIRSICEDYQPRKRVRRVCVIAPSHFRLWDPSADVLIGPEDATPTLSSPGNTGGGNVCAAESASPVATRLDTDDPAAASGLWLAMKLGEVDAVLAANLARADAPGVAATELPWVTWVTSPRIPPAANAGPRDLLLLADPAWQALAESAGWPASKVHVATWPSVYQPTQQGGEPLLAIIADTATLEPPTSVTDYSSRLLLWELIRSDLRQDPFAIGDDLDAYLKARMERLNVSPEGFDLTAFVESLIVPAYQQGLAKVLMDHGLPVRLFGRHWDDLDQFKGYADGPITSREQFEQAIDLCTALVHTWPQQHRHPIETCGRPVVRAMGCSRERFVTEAKAALVGSLPVPPPQAPVLSLNRLEEILAE